MATSDAPRDHGWYQRRWEELMDLLATTDPNEVVDRVRELQIQVLDEEAERLDDLGLPDNQDAETVLRRIFRRLQDLRRENQTARTLQTAVDANSPEEAIETVETLQDRLATLEQQQETLSDAGFEDSEQALQAIKQLKRELETVRQKGEGSDQPSASARAEDVMEEELGLSDPEAIVEMIHDLTDQLKGLYGAQERLTDVNLDGPEEAVEMMQTMQNELESLYEQRKKLSERGLASIDHALSMIDSIEAQLTDVYEDRDTQTDVKLSTGADDRLEELEDELETLADEKSALREKRDHLRGQLQVLENNVGTDDPRAISDLIGSLEEQLQTVYDKRKEQEERRSVPSEETVLDPETIEELEQLNDGELDALSAGLFCVDDQGTIRRANENALSWPDVPAESTDALRGENFFTDVAPGTNNALFRGRFEDGIEAGAMDDQFVYTYVGEHSSATNVAVHLHRKEDQTVSWIAFTVK